MRVLRHIAIAAAAIVMTALSTYARIKPTPTDAETILFQYFDIVGSENSDAELARWLSTKSDTELAALPIIIGFGMINQIESPILSDSSVYNACLSAIGLIQKGMNTIDQSGDTDALYLTTSDAGLIPARYILANAYDRAYKYPEADSAYVATAKEVGRDFGRDSEEFVYWSNCCAGSLQRKNINCEKAILLMLPAKEAALHSPDVTDPTACDFLLSLARYYLRAGDHSEALNLAKEAEKRSGDDRQLIFNVSNMLGELYLNEGNNDAARDYFNKAEANAPSLRDFFEAGVNFADLMRRTGFPDTAESTLLGLANYVDSEELSFADLFNYYESLGVFYTFTNPDQSEAYFQKAKEYLGNVGYPEMIRHILNSEVYPNADNSFKVISALDRSEMLFSLIGDEPRLLNEILMLKGYYLLDIGDCKTAREYLEAAYLRMLDYASGDPQLLTLLQRLAKLDEIEGGEDFRREYYLHQAYRGASSHGESSELYSDALAELLHFYLQIGDTEPVGHYLDIYRKIRPDSFETRCYEYRALLLEGKTPEAEKSLIAIKDDFPGQREAVNLMIQRHYAAAGSERITDVATDVFDDYRRELLRNLLFMSDRERRNMEAELKSRRDEILSALSFAPSLGELALNYSLFSKGLLFHTQNDIARTLVDNDSARMEMAVIKGLKAELEQAVNSLDKLRAHSIQRSIDSRQRYLIDDYLNHDAFARHFDRYNISSLQADMTPDDLMIDFVEYSDSGSSRLGCFLIEKGKPVEFIGLGTIDDLADLADERNVKGIWSKITPRLTPDKRIFFSTDGILNTLPIEFAEDEAGVPMCEKYELHRVFHLSDICKSQGIGDRVEAIGVADHNSPAGEARRLDDGYRGNWNDLAGVETELYRIAESLDGVCDYHRVLNDDATEAYLKSLSGQPITTLHISTHGFYRSENQLTKAFNDPEDFDHNMALRLLTGNRSSVAGLVMRNGNLSWKAATITADEDNILTSEEVETLSFPNLSLTVLSACETGLGELSADGVWGLQRAFRIAGSGSLICSLRQVKDSGAADFMAGFYRLAATGMSVHDAFYNARKELLSHDPANKIVWSSFILIE